MKSKLLAKILKYLIYACALVPLVIFSQYISPFHFGKVVVFRSLIEIMLALYILLAWSDRSYRPKTDKIFWALLGFVVAFTVTSLASVNTFQSFWGTLERMGGLWSFWHYFVFYVILVSVLRTKEDWIKLLKITTVVGVLSALYGFGQRTNIEWFIGGGGRVRIFGTIGNAALFAGYQILNVFISLILALSVKDKIQRNLFFIATGIMTLAVFMTAVRGSILGISVGFVIFAFLYFSYTHSRQAKNVFVGLVTLIALFVLGALAFQNSSVVTNSPYLTRVTDFSLSNRTVETRVWAWQAGLKGWSESPKTILLGWGPENFNIPFSKYFNPQFFKGPGSETLFDRAHNMFVEVLVTMGLVGLLTYISIFVVALMALWKLRHDSEKRIFSMGLIALVVAYIIHNAFIFDTSANFIVFFTVLGLTSFLTREQYQERVSSVNDLSTSQWLVAVLLLVSAIVLIYKTNILQSKANYTSTRGIVAGFNNDFNSAVSFYKKSISYNVPGKYEERNKLAQYLLDYSASEKAKSPSVIEVYKYAIEEEKKNATENNLDYIPELYLSRLNIILGKDDPASPYNDEALLHSQKALTYSETFVRTYYEIAQGYLNKKDYVNAREAFEKAIDLSPTVGLSYWYLGAIYIQEGNTQRGLELIDDAIKYGYQLGESEYLNLANAYVKSGDLEHLVTIYEGLVRLEPTKVQYLASLAVVYSRLGRIDEAVASARLAVKIDPSFEADARAFVQSLGRVW